MKNKPAGYSGTTLLKKLGYKEGFIVMLHNAPSHYRSLLGDLPPDVQLTAEVEPGPGTADLIHLFYTSAQALSDTIGHYKEQLKKNGMVWVSWPKGSSDIETDLNRELVRDLVLQTGLVDIKVAAIDDDWSGLKFVYRAKDR